MVATPMLREAMKRLKHNIDLITARMLEKGYPLALECAACQRPYLVAMGGDAVHEHAEEAVNSRGMRLPLALQIFWEELGGVALASKHCMQMANCSPFCICKQPENPDRLMVCCERCDAWFHGGAGHE